MITSLVLLFPLFLLAAAVVSPIDTPGARQVAAGLTVVGCALGLVLGLAVLLSPAPLDLLLPGFWPTGTPASLHLDGLAAVFLLAITLLGAAAALYAPSYLAAYADVMNLRLVSLGLPLFLLTMATAVLAGDIFTFLVAYETMSLISFLLVLSEYRRRAAQHAALIYLIITHVGTALAVAGLLIASSGCPDLTWTCLGASTRALPGTLRSLLFLLFLVGFGTKAGLVPLHVWLPRAHPQAPSHVSALMSGVMVKVALYALIRSLILIGPGPSWWGNLLLAVGAASAVFGILYALPSRDLKRLLAYSTVENVGIITLGIGLFSLGLSRDDHALASLGLLAGLYHAVNHACFKGLLFFGAGAVQRSCHTRDIEELGGLWCRMPATAALFLLGSVAIAGLPPLNGFVSELLTYHSLLVALSSSGGTGRFILLLALSGLALTAGLAAMGFVKAFGVTFLGKPRSEKVSDAAPVPTGMIAGMAIPALAVIALGLFPGFFARLFARALPPAVLNLEGRAFGLATPWGTYAPLLLLAGLVFVLVAIHLVVRLAGGIIRIRRHASWNCGGVLTPRMEYNSGSFAKPIRVIFRRILVQKAERAEGFLESKRFKRVRRYEEHVVPVWTRRVYLPIRNAIVGFAGAMRKLQAGPVNLYLGYLFLAFLIVLVVMSR